MGYAQTAIDAPGGFSGTLTIYQLDTASRPMSIGVTATLTGPGGTVGLWVEEVGVNAPPQGFPDYEVRLYGRAASGTMPPPSTYRLLGTWDWNGLPPPLTDWTWDGAATAEEAASGSQETLHLYKQRQVMDPLPNDLASPCHPLHLEMHYAWGNVEGYTDQCGSSIVSDSVGGKTMTPSDGTRDLAALVVGLGIAQPDAAVSGVVARWTNLRYLGESVDLSDFNYSADGVEVVGDGDTLTLSVTNWAQIPSGGAGSSATIYAPIIVYFDLIGYDWGIEATSGGGGAMEFDIPRNYPDPETGSMVDQVSSHYVERRTYWNYSWKTGYVRPWSLSPMVNAAWAAANYENVDPTDLPCTIEESGLGCDPEVEWEGFAVRRSAAVGVQKPADASALPSLWNPLVDTRVEQGTIITEVYIQPGATAASVRRTLLEDYFRLYITSTGIATYGLPGAYRNLKHQAESDVWNWENYKFLELSYTSGHAQRIWLTVEYWANTVTDSHVTGGERVTDFLNENPSRTLQSVAFAIDIIQTEPSQIATAYIDLAMPDLPELRHVYRLTLSGFENETESEWLFCIVDLRLVQRNPTSGAETGLTDAKITFARPDGGLPISYTGFTATAEGDRCCRPPDQIHTLCGEAGLDFCERLTGSGSGTILDFMRTLPEWFTELNRQEGFSVSGAGDSPMPCQFGHSTYDAAFVDADGNDMLGGTLYTGDVQEQIDTVIGTDPTVLPVLPRVGTVYLAAGTPITCKVIKRVHGSAHGLMHSGGVRAGPDETVALWEQNTGLITTCLTDDWSRWAFKGKPGVRELLALGISTSEDAEPATWVQIYNELRVWAQAIPGGCPRVALAYCKQSGHAMVLRSDGTQIYSKETLDNGVTWNGEEVAFAGVSPCAFYDAAGNVVCLYANLGGLRMRSYDGAWSAEVTVAMGYECPSAAYVAPEDRAYIVARQSGALYCMAAERQTAEPYGLTVIETPVAIGTLDEGNAEITMLGEGALLATYYNSATGDWVGKKSSDRGQTWVDVDMGG